MIRPTDLVGAAMRALRANPMRSALTALGVIIGVSSVVAMVALGAGAQARVESSISSLGSNLLIVVPGAQRGAGGVRGAAGGWDALTLGDAEAIERDVANISAVAPVQNANGQMVANGLNWNTRVMGVTPAYFIARDLAVENGRELDETDVSQARRVILLGPTVAENLFPNMDPVGQTVRLNGGTYDVIGVLETKGQSGFQDQDDMALAPLTTVKRRIAGRRGRGDSISQISIKAASEDVIPLVEADVIDLLRVRHRTNGDDDDFTVQNLASITDAMKNATQTFTLLLAAIAGVSLLVGGIGIMNIMLVSVTERTREIGLRKALGARRGDILNQFGLEAIALSVAGGAIGLVVGFLGAWAITGAMDLPLVLNVETPIYAIVFSGLVGVTFGAYPAWRAARLDPIEALRRE
ncbi:MAG: FtsX-like permease family protein [Alphaproteobacteria bacterium]|nr:FtsX-like permease family protein [Alphaproteobacteria bacterium]